MIGPAPENPQKNTVVKKQKNMDSAYPQSDGVRSESARSPLGVRSEKQWECKDLGQLDGKHTSIAALKKTIAIKLKRTREDYNINTPPPLDSRDTVVDKLSRYSKKKDIILKQNRRNGRRKGVSDNCRLFLIPR